MDGLGGEVSSVKSIAPLGSISVPLVRVTETQLAVVAASLGTIFEWYDFFLYATLAVFFSALFFPPGNETAALLASLATFGAGFAVRPFGALIFGALGDRIGRKNVHGNHGDDGVFDRGDWFATDIRAGGCLGTCAAGIHETDARTCRW